MSRSAPRLFCTAYFASQSFADRGLPSKFGKATTHANALLAATKHMLDHSYCVAVVYGPLRQRLTTVVRKGRAVTVAGLLP